MPHLIESPSRVEAAGTKPILIDEFVGRLHVEHESGARYVAICLPAFAPDTVHRDT